MATASEAGVKSVRSRWRSPLVATMAITITTGLLASALSACSVVSSPRAQECAPGNESFEASLLGFLTAAQADDRTAAAKHLKPGGTIPDDAWQALHSSLADEDPQKLTLLGDQNGPAASYRVIRSGGTLLGQFEVHQLEDNSECHGVLWGSYAHQDEGEGSSPEPEASPDSSEDT